MKKLVHALVLTGLVGVPAIATADAPASPHTLSGNIALTSDYVFRGISQSQNEAAIQGGFDYAHSSGFYAGTWASSQSWVKEGGYKNDSSMEIDLYGGYKGSMGDIGYDVGVITYYYPGDQVAGANDPDTTEVYLGASWKFLSAKYSYTVSDRFVGWGTADDPANTNGDTDGSYYIELNANYGLDNGWGLIGHVGYQDVKDNDAASYTDWKIGVSKDIGFGVITASYSDTDADTTAYTWAGEEVADGRFFVTFSKTF
jgi:uncharacterized protein (TIGR02001 family)